MKLDFSPGVHHVKNTWLECCYVVGDHYVNVDRLDVIPEVRSRGLGTRFMQQFIEESPYSIVLSILYNRPLNFYIRLGFKVHEVLGIDEYGNICDATLEYTKETK